MRIKKQDLDALSVEIRKSIWENEFKALMKRLDFNFAHAFYGEEEGKFYIYAKCPACESKVRFIGMDASDVHAGISLSLSTKEESLAHELERIGRLKTCQCGEKIAVVDPTRTWIQLGSKEGACFLGEYKGKKFVAIQESNMWIKSIIFSNLQFRKGFFGNDQWVLFWENGDINGISCKKGKRKESFTITPFGSLEIHNLKPLGEHDMLMVKDHVGSAVADTIKEITNQNEKIIVRMFLKKIDLSDTKFQSIQEIVDVLREKYNIRKKEDIENELSFNETINFNPCEEGPFLGDVSSGYYYYEKISIGNEYYGVKIHKGRYFRMKVLEFIHFPSSYYFYNILEYGAIPMKLYIQNTIMDDFTKDEVEEIIGEDRKMWKRVFNFLHSPLAIPLEGASRQRRFQHLKNFVEIAQFRYDSGLDKKLVFEVEEQPKENMVSAEKAEQMLEKICEYREFFPPEVFFVFGKKILEDIISLSSARLKWLGILLGEEIQKFLVLDFFAERIERIRQRVSMEDLVDYIIDCTNLQGIKNLRMALDYWKDFIVFSENLGLPLDGDKVFPESLSYSHDVTARAWAAIEDEAMKNKFIDRVEKQKVNNFSDNDFLIRAPFSVDDLKNEGVELRHCVGSYVKSVASGGSDVYFLRKTGSPDKSFVTVEVRKGKISQANGAENKNHMFDKKIEAFLKGWIKSYQTV